MHEDCLPPATLDLLGRIATVARQHGLALGGGSACALHLGHRTSADLDLFALTPLDPPALLASLEAVGERRLRGISANELALVVDGVELSATSLAREPLDSPSEHRGVPLLSPADLAELKVAAAIARSAARDLCDLHLLCLAGVDLERATRASEIDLVVALKALTDAARYEAQPALDLRREWSVEEAVEFFGREAERLLAP